MSLIDSRKEVESQIDLWLGLCLYATTMFSSSIEFAVDKT